MSDICSNYHGDNERSVEAHDSIVSDKKRQSVLILAYLAKNGGATCEEVEFALDMKHQTASARMSELKKAGIIVPVGRRPTTSGRDADVCELRPLEVAA